MTLLFWDVSRRVKCRLCGFEGLRGGAFRGRNLTCPVKSCRGTLRPIESKQINGHEHVVEVKCEPVVLHRLSPELGEEVIDFIARMARRTPEPLGRKKWTAILRKDPCAWCGAHRSGTVDHVEPRAKGGPKSHRSDNSSGACARCNQDRGPASLLAFLAYRAGWT